MTKQKGSLPLPSVQAKQIVSTWRAVVGSDDLLQRYIEQAITDNVNEQRNLSQPAEDARVKWSTTMWPHGIPGDKVQTLIDNWERLHCAPDLIVLTKGAKQNLYNMLRSLLPVQSTPDSEGYRTRWCERCKTSHKYSAGRVSDTLSSKGRPATNPEHEESMSPSTSDPPLRPAVQPAASTPTEAVCPECGGRAGLDFHDKGCGFDKSGGKEETPVVASDCTWKPILARCIKCSHRGDIRRTEPCPTCGCECEFTAAASTEAQNEVEE